MSDPEKKKTKKKEKKEGKKSKAESSGGDDLFIKPERHERLAWLLLAQLKTWEASGGRARCSL